MPADEEAVWICSHQVRHLVLDTDAWTPSVRQLFAQSGNAAGNAVWQSGARTHIAAAAWEVVRIRSVDPHGRRHPCAVARKSHPRAHPGLFHGFGPAW